MWVVRNEVLENHPDVVSAFVAAEQQATAALIEKKPTQVAKLVHKYWKLEPQDGAKIVKDELVFRRGWIWATAGDAAVLQNLSKIMAANDIVPKPVSWDDLKAAFEPASAAVKAGYKAAGSNPSTSEFQSTSKDLRGPSSWKLDEWGEPSK